MITERHLFRLFVNDQIQVPTLLHSICACIDTSDDPSSVFTSMMLLVLLLQQNLTPVKPLIAAGIKLMRSQKVTVERRRFMCVMLLRYTAGRYLDFLRFDEQMDSLLRQLLEVSGLLAKGSNERVAERIVVESKELELVLSASPYAGVSEGAETPVKEGKTQRNSEGAKTGRSTTAGTPSPDKPREGVSLLTQLRHALSEITESVPTSLRHKVTEFANRKVKEVVDFCEKHDEKADYLLEDYLRSLLSAIEDILSVVRRKARITPNDLQSLFDSCSLLPDPDEA